MWKVIFCKASLEDIATLLLTKMITVFPIKCQMPHHWYLDQNKRRPLLSAAPQNSALIRNLTII